MTKQRPDQAISPVSYGDVPATAPGRAPAVPPVRTSPTSTTGARRVLNDAGPAVNTGRTRSRRQSPRSVLAVAVGVAVALAGAAAAFGLNWWGSQPHDDKPPAVASSHSPTREPLARRQAALNRARFPAPAIADFAEPWLPTVSDCITDVSSGGPQRSTGEQSRTRCTAGFITTYWISYHTLADRDRAQARYRAQAANAPKLAPGATPPVDRIAPGGSRKVQYIEYAYEIPSGERAGQVVVAVWWSDPTQPIAGVFLAYWSEDLGSSWVPLRDLWNQAS